MNTQTSISFDILDNTIRHFFEHGGAGYSLNHPHAARKLATLEGALALVASADFILKARATRGHYHSLLEEIERQRDDLVHLLDAVEGAPDTAVAAGRRSA